MFISSFTKKKCLFVVHCGNKIWRHLLWRSVSAADAAIFFGYLGIPIFKGLLNDKKANYSVSDNNVKLSFIAEN